jgi:hypothetical protein
MVKSVMVPVLRVRRIVSCVLQTLIVQNAKQGNNCIKLAVRITALPDHTQIQIQVIIALLAVPNVLPATLQTVTA